MEYTSVREAKDLPGLRLALSAGVPGPWSIAAKGLFKVRNVDFVPVLQEIGTPNEDLVAWTGHRNAPVAVYENEAPRTGWVEILHLAERLGSGPSMIPDDPRERALMMGFSHELASEDGLGWCRRLSLVHPALEAGPSHPAYEFSKLFGGMYGYTKAAGDAAESRVAQILTALSEQYERQQEGGRRYLVGETMTALDLYWASFASLIVPLPDELCPMAPEIRAMYESSPPGLRSAASPALLAHRDFIFESALGLPMEF